MIEQTHDDNFDKTTTESSLDGMSDSLPILDIDVMKKISSETGDEDTSDDDEPINYMAKDFESFRHALFQIASRKFPNWKLRSDADIRTALIDLFSFVGDELSYYQDAVANEAFLKTARKRSSVQSHLALIDYKLHNGCSSASFLKMSVNDGKHGFLPKGFQSHTPASARQSEIIFETDRAYKVSHRNNAIKLHLMRYDVHSGNGNHILSKNSTGAYLTGFYHHLKKGDHLLIEEDKKMDIVCLDADPEFGYDVPKSNEDKVEKGAEHGGFSSFEEQQEALQRQIAKTRKDNPERYDDSYMSYTKVSWTSNSLKYNYTTDVRICANVIKITQGYQIPNKEVLKRSGDSVKKFVFELEFAPLAFVSDTLQPHRAKSTLEIHVGGELWEETDDLSSMGPFDKSFLVTINDKGQNEVLLGDGIHGKRPYPWSSIVANYRIGAGSNGNVGRSTITEFDQKRYSFIKNIMNPVSALGGVDPESLESARILGPKNIKYQERAITPEDYSRLITKKFSNVGEVRTNFEYTGSWNTAIISVDFEDHIFSDSNLSEIKQYVDKIRIAGHDVHIRPAKYISPEIKITIHLKPGFNVRDVENRLYSRLGNNKDENGGKGFFHSDNFSFGEAIFVSRLYDQIEGIEGIDYSVITKFKRYRKTGDDLSQKNISSDHVIDADSKKNLSQGFIPVNKDETVLFNNDSMHPEQGMLLFTFVESQ